MKKNNVQVNSVLNIIKTLLVLTFPLITFPYAFRVLGVNNIGAYSFSKSVVNYFVLIAGLGMGRYAVREGARYRGDKDQFSRFASQMLTVSLVMMVVSYGMLAIYIYFSSKIQAYRQLVYIESLTIVISAVGMEWMFSSLEEYTYLTIRTLVTQVVSIALLFLLVRDETDLVKYSVVLLISNVGGYAVNIVYVLRHYKIRLDLRGAVKHLPSLLLLFSSEVASVIYVNSDVTMLGYIAGDYQVGIYTVSSKIYSVAQQVLSAAILVTLPRLSYYYAAGQEKEYRQLVSNSFNMTVLLGIPAAVGLCMVAGDAVLIFGGAEYAESRFSLMILCLSLAVSLFGILYTNTLLLPMKMEKQITFITVAAALVNVGLNIFILPMLGHVGAAITTVIAEMVVMFSQAVLIRRVMRISLDRATVTGTVIGCLWICVCVSVVSACIHSLWLHFAISVLTAAAGYMFIQYLFKNIYVMNALEAVRKKLHAIK